MTQGKIIGAVVFVAVGFGVIYMQGQKQETPTVVSDTQEQTIVQNNDEVSQESTSAPTSGKKIPFADFLKQGGSYVCSVMQSVEGTESKGTTYIDGEKIRGEFQTATQGLNIISTFIIRDEYTYTWSSMMPSMGFKIKNNNIEGSQNSEAGVQGTYSFNAETIGDYACDPWTPDSAKFELPSDTTFREI